MLYTSFSKDLGLLNGKMGVCVFFYKYARYSGNKRYADFAGEILNEVYDEIHAGYARDFKSGLAGIGWGIEYLVAEGFVQRSADDLLGDIDPFILERDVRRVTDLSLETGLEGLAHYVLARHAHTKPTHIDNTYLGELKQSLLSNGAGQSFITGLDNLSKGKPADYTFHLIDALASRSVLVPPEKQNIGITHNGLAGIAIKLTNELHR